MPRTLLLADDSITIQKVVAITFAAEDFKVVAVDNGEDALAKARELKPAVILADVVMPKRNGYEVAHAIKSDPELAHTPVLLLAGTFEPFDPAKATASRADGHIVKPFDSQALIDKVNELLGGAPAAQPVAARPAVPAAAAPTWSTPGAPPAPRAPLPSSPSGMPQRPQPLSTTIPRPASVPAPPAPVAHPLGAPAAPPVVAPTFAPPAPLPPQPAARPAFTPAPIPLSTPTPAAAPLPLRPAATAAPLPLRPAPLPLTQPTPAAPTFAAPLPLTQPVAAPAARPAAPAPAPIPLSTPSWGGAATPRPPAPAFASPSRAPMPTSPSQAPAPIALTPSWGTALDLDTPIAPSAPPAHRDPFGLGTPAPAPGPKTPIPTPTPPAALMAEAAAAASVQTSLADIPLDVPIEYEQQDSSDGFELGGSQDLDVRLSSGSFTSGSLSDFAQQDTPVAAGAIELTEESEDEPMELASPHEFLGGMPTPSVPTPVYAPKPVAPTFTPPTPARAPLPLQLKPTPPSQAPKPPAPSLFTPAPVPVAAAPAASASGNGEAALRLALSQASREVIERIVWEVVPQLAETIIREHVERLAQERSGK